MLPLPPHLQMLMQPFMSWHASSPGFGASWPAFAPAWPNWSASWPVNPLINPLINPLENPLLNPLAGAAQHPLLNANANPVLEEMLRVSADQWAEISRGLALFEETSFTHVPTRSTLLWQRGSAQLRDYAPHATEKTAVLCIPSLINKSYILDLMPRASFIAYLKQQGFRPLLLDWGEPSDTEASFDSSDYIQAYALAALNHLRQHHDGPIVLMGYCMGGVLALALAQLAAKNVDGLILLATPWDFASSDTPIVLINPASQATLRQIFSQHDTVPPWMIQQIFFWMNPFAKVNKMQKFAGLNGEEKARFIAIEHWARDGAAMTSALATECFVDWPQLNMLATHRYHVGRSWIDPAHVRCETLIIAAKRDMIVPLGCAKPLRKEIKRAQLLTPDTGHVGIVAGGRARTLCWEPVAEWMHERF